MTRTLFIVYLYHKLIFVFVKIFYKIKVNVRHTTPAQQAAQKKEKLSVGSTFNVLVMSARFKRHRVLLGLGEVRWRRQMNRNYLRLKLKNYFSFRY